MLLFELKKHWRQKINLVTLLVLLLLLLTTFLGLKTTRPNAADDADSTLTTAYQRAYDGTNQQLDALDAVKPQTAAIKKHMAYLKTERQHLQDVMMAASGIYSNAGDATVKKGRREMIRTMLTYQKYTLHLAQAHNLQFTPISRGGAAGASSVAARQTDVRFYQYLLAHDLFELPLAKGNVPAANYLLNTFFNKLSPLMLLIFASLPAAAVLTFERRRGTAGFAATLPVIPARPLITRIAAALLITLPVVAVAIGLTYWVVGRTMGYGYWRYPLVDGAGRLMTAGHALAQYGALLAAAVVLLVMLAACVAQLTASTGAVAVVCAGLIALAQPTLLSFGPIRAASRMLPWGYLHFDRVITGTTPWPAWGPSVGLAVLFAWAGGLFALALALNRRRQRVR
ncbi:hypothetical protein [Lacticaseibacillus suihuaensis]